MSSDSEILPPPNEPSAFESLCLDLWKDIWKDTAAQKNGRKGQHQAGVDIFGQFDGRHAGIQCKQKSGLLRTRLTIPELENEVQTAKTFRPKLDLFIVATSGPRDKNAQRHANQLSEKHKRRGLFKVEVWSWEDIWRELYSRPDLLENIGLVYWPRLWTAFAGKVKTRSFKLYNVPELPPHFLPRPSDLAALKTYLLAPQCKKVAITGMPVKTGIHGMGGIGKTVLATALVHESEIRESFPDGVIWLTFGLTPDLMALQRQIGQACGDNPPIFDNEQQGRSYLSGLLTERAILLVFDDLWNEEHIVPFNVLGSHCAMLVTTRDARIVRHYGAAERQIDILSEEEGFKLLSGWTKLSISGSHLQTGWNLVRECGCLPLAIAMIGARVNGDPDEMDRQLARLRARSLKLIERHHPEYQYPHLLRALEVSVDALESDTIAGLKERYLDFAIFPEDKPIPSAVLETLWGKVGESVAHDALDRLVDLALLGRERNGWLRLHDLQYDYLRQATKNESRRLQMRLVDSYRKICDDRCLESEADHKLKWSKGPNDGYFFQNILSHIELAGLTLEARSLRFDLHWLQAKLDATDVSTLITDYQNVTQDEQLKLVALALYMSAPVLALDKAQLFEQLSGRLSSADGAEIRTLLEAGGSLLNLYNLRPLQPTLRRAGESLLLDLRDNQNGIAAISVSADGRKAASASWDGTLSLWDLDVGRCVQTFDEDLDKKTAVVMTRKGDRVISVALNGALRIWNVNSGQKLNNLTSHGARTTSIAVAPDDSVFVTGAQDGTITVWDLHNGRQISQLIGHVSDILGLAITPDRQFVVSGCKDWTIRVWDLKSGQTLKVLEGHDLPVLSVAVTHDGQRIISASADRSVRSWDLKNGEVLCEGWGHMDRVTAICVTPDGRYAVSGSQDRTLRVWDLANGNEVSLLAGHTGWVSGVSVTADGLRVVSSALDGTLKVWKLDAGRPPWFPHQSWVSSVVALPDSRRAISAAGDGMIKIWDMAQRGELQTLRGDGSAVSAIVITPDGRQAISASDHFVRIWNIENTGKAEVLKAHDKTVTSLAIALKGSWLLSAASYAYYTTGELKLWDLKSKTELRKLSNHETQFHGLSASRDSQIAIWGSQNGHLKVWDLENWEELNNLPGHTGPIVATAINANGRRAISASTDGNLIAWDLELGRILHRIHASKHKILSVAISADGTRAVSGSEDRQLKAWSLDTGLCLSTFTAESAVTCCTIAMDIRMVIAGEESGRLHFLRLEGIEL